MANVEEIDIQELFPFGTYKRYSTLERQQNFQPIDGASATNLSATDEKLLVYKPSMISGSKQKEFYKDKVLRDIAIILQISPSGSKEALAEAIKTTWRTRYPRSWKMVNNIKTITNRMEESEELSGDESRSREEGSREEKVVRRSRPKAIGSRFMQDD